MQIGIICIGTELTVGQVINRNAAWIADKLKKFGNDCQFHLTVPDNKETILDSFNFAKNNCQVLFITGGLGPTSDDFTREVFAEWSGKKLIWDESSWQHIHDRLRPRGYQVKDIQRQQCYFPESAKILKNSMGTANAFHSHCYGMDCFILPGPPRELEAIWTEHIESWIQTESKPGDAIITRSWDTLKVGESEVAEKVMQALGSCPYEIGYRVHLPYVEVKISYPISEKKTGEVFVQKIENALAPITALRDAQDAARSLCEVLNKFSHVTIIDQIPGSFLMQRIFPFLKPLLLEKKISFSSRSFGHEPIEKSSKGELILNLEEVPQGEFFLARIQAGFGQKKLDLKIPPAYENSLMKERQQQYFAEMAMIKWHEFLIGENI